MVGIGPYAVIKRYLFKGFSDIPYVLDLTRHCDAVEFLVESISLCYSFMSSASNVVSYRCQLDATNYNLSKGVVVNGLILDTTSGNEV